MSAPAWETVRDTPNLTYRQFDYWCSKGWVRVDPNAGIGVPRTLTEHEAKAAVLMADLVAAGLTPSAAAGLARQLAAVDVATLGGKFNVSRAAS